MIHRRSWIVYGLLLVIWGVFLGWQVAEHVRVRRSARAALIDRAKDISNTVALVMRSQRRFGGVISRERMEGALKDIVKPGELNGIALLNAAGDVVASAGEAPELHSSSRTQQGQLWDRRAVTLVNLVDLGTNLTQELERPSPTIVVPRSELFPPGDTNRPPGSQDSRTNLATGTNEQRAWRPPPDRNRTRGTNESGVRRPFWMSEEEFKSLREKQGVHSFVLTMSTAPLHASTSNDLWLRCIIGVLATISVAGSSLAWRSVQKTADLQIRLVRASELNSHLKEMNLAAAGLAHETRNPLNIIRGVAQLISKQPDTSTDVRQKTREIINETDRVTGQLNEFINYARPREVRQTSVALDTVVNEVARALTYDIEEKAISVQVKVESVSILADEQLLRQALFNLVLNAVQAVDTKGSIEVWAGRTNGRATLEIRDNGPGVAPEHRKEIFKPYFTTQQTGTGLGLAVVQQIVLAHGWDIQCIANEPRGAIFRITHLKIATKG